MNSFNFTEFVIAAVAAAIAGLIGTRNGIF